MVGRRGAVRGGRIRPSRSLAETPAVFIAVAARKAPDGRLSGVCEAVTFSYKFGALPVSCCCAHSEWSKLSLIYPYMPMDV